MPPQELTSHEFKKFQEFIYTASGIRIPDTKRTLLSNRIRRRLKAGDFDDFASYYQHLTSGTGRDELEGFLDAVTTNETFFFRTEKHFEWFRTDFITDVAQRARRGERPRTLRIWSAACSTGEEPYSLAICLAENQLRLRGWTLEIVGTDISEQVLQTAREASYGERSLEKVSDTQRRRYLRHSKEDQRWQVRPAVRELVHFQSHNLMKPLNLPPFDCVFIRNVLIYFDRESKRKVVENIVKSMADGAYLVVGPSEGIFDMLGMLQKRSPSVYQK